MYIGYVVNFVAVVSSNIVVMLQFYSVYKPARAHKPARTHPRAHPHTPVHTRAHTHATSVCVVVCVLLKQCHEIFCANVYFCFFRWRRFLPASIVGPVSLWGFLLQLRRGSVGALFRRPASAARASPLRPPITLRGYTFFSSLAA